MSRSLSSELAALPPDVAERLRKHHFDSTRFLELAASLEAGGVDKNRVAGEVSAPLPSDFAELPAPGSVEEERLRERGLSELRAGRAGLVVMAGGMATRMGGVVKALVEALPGKTFLDLRLAEQAALEELAGRPVPLFLMTSTATDGKIKEALGAKLDGRRIAAFPQRIALRLTPEGALFRDSRGNPSEHAPGHGDLIDALRDSGLLAQFIAGGGTHLTVTNLDNLGATLDPVLIGLHAEQAVPVLCEVVDKLETDRGGIPVRYGTSTVVLEEFRLPAAFDAATVRVFSTNTFHLDAGALANLSAKWSYFVVTKKVDGASAIQFERLVGELTSFLETRYVRVPRSGPASRFLPVKDNEELAARRDEIFAVASSRGMLQ